MSIIQLLSKRTKLLFLAFVILLIICLFNPAIILILALLGIFFSFSFVKSIKEVNNSKLSKCFSVILINLIIGLGLYLALALSFYKIDGFGGIVPAIIFFISLLGLLISTIIQISMMPKNGKKESINLNKTLSIIFIILFLVAFYNPIMEKTCSLTKNTNFCGAIISINVLPKNNIYSSANTGQALYSIAMQLKNPNVCSFIKSPTKEYCDRDTSFLK